MNINFYLDPFVLACPRASEGVQMFENYVHEILSWRTMVRRNWAQFHITDQAMQTLVNAKRYPVWHDLRDALTRLNVKGVQAKDVVVLVDSLIQKSSSVEHSIGVDDVLYEDGVLNPRNHIENREKTFQDQYFRTLVLMAMVGILKKIPSDKQILLSRHTDGRILVKITSTLVYVEGAWNSTRIPFSLNESFLSVSNQYEVYKSVNSTDIWMSSPEQHVKKEAIYLAMFQRHGVDCWHEEENPDEWGFGNAFLASCDRFGFEGDAQKASNLICAIADCLCQASMRNTHQIRIHSAGNSPQLIRSADGAGAWRRDIDHEFHLHYWQLGGVIELASVVPHNDFSIPA